MGLIGELYVFPDNAPTHDEVWRVLCEVAGREIQKREQGPPANEETGVDWRAAEKKGHLLTGGTTTTFYDRGGNVALSTLIRGDKIFVSGSGASLHKVLAVAMKRLGGEPEPSRHSRQKKAGRCR